MAARSKSWWVWGRSLAGIVGLNPSEGTDINLFWMLSFVRQRSLRRADPLSRGVLPSVCVTQYEQMQQ
jgi:hypothetical protein